MITMALQVSFALLGIMFLGLISSEKVCVFDSAKSIASGLPNECDQVLESINDIDTGCTNMSITLHSGTHFLSKILLFENTVNISIASFNKSKIVYDKFNAAIAFKHSSNIRIEQVSIELCGGMFNSTSTMHLC